MKPFYKATRHDTFILICDKMERVSSLSSSFHPVFRKHFFTESHKQPWQRSVRGGTFLWRMCVWQTFLCGRLRVGLTEFSPSFSEYDPHNSSQESPQGKCRGAGGGDSGGKRWTANECGRRGSEPGKLRPAWWPSSVSQSATSIHR